MVLGKRVIIFSWANHRPGCGKEDNFVTMAHFPLFFLK
jgi:hypothetical protein